jgi:PAS domain S-box-containing protein
MARDLCSRSTNRSASGWKKRRKPWWAAPFGKRWRAFPPIGKFRSARVRESSAPFERLDLKLAAGDARPPQWFTLEIGRGPQNGFARLSSMLPPLADLEEGIWDEHLRNDAARREMFVRLLRAEARLEGLTRRWPCVIFSQRPDFSLQFASPNIKELTGMDATDWSGLRGRFWDLVHESDAAELQQQFKRAAQTGEAVTNTYRIRHVVTGRVAYILEHRQPAISQSGLLLGYEVVWLDVTRQTIAEKRLSDGRVEGNPGRSHAGHGARFHQHHRRHPFVERIVFEHARGEASVLRGIVLDQEEFVASQPVGAAHDQPSPRPDGRAQLP